MFPHARRIFSVRGIDVRVDVSWVIIAVLVVWSLWSRLELYYGHGTALTVPLAVLGAVLFFGSVLVHELAHALEARHRGVSVGGITLFLFGGVTESRMDAERPGDEFALSAVGPYASFVLAGAFGLSVYVIHTFVPSLRPLADVLGIVGWINVALAVFNLLPGAPLDGGRVLRSAVWKLTGDRGRATEVASLAGQGLGAVLIGVGALQFLTFAAGSFSGLWLAFIGWFLFTAAKRERMTARLEHQLSGHAVRELVTPSVAGVDADAPVLDAARALARTDADVVPVEEAGRLIGVVEADAVRSVARGRRDELRVRDVMRPRADLDDLDADASAAVLLDAARNGEPLVVADADRVGVASPLQLTRAIERVQVLDGPPSRVADRRRRRSTRDWIPHRRDGDPREPDREGVP